MKTKKTNDRAVIHAFNNVPVTFTNVTVVVTLVTSKHNTLQ